MSSFVVIFSYIVVLNPANKIQSSNLTLNLQITVGTHLVAAMFTNVGR
jgi:hypothetical protein